MRLFKNILLVLLLFSSLATLGAAGVWNYRPDFVQWFDAKWSNRHKKTVRMECDRLVVLSRDNPQAAIQPLIDLADELRPYRKADFRYHTRKKVLKALSEVLLANGNYEQGAGRAAELVSLDERDITTRLWFGRLLLQYSETRVAGLEELKKTYQTLPEYGMVTRAYAKALLSLGLEAEAVGVVVRHLELSPDSALSAEFGSGGWEYWWSDSNAFGVDRRGRSRPEVHGDESRIPFKFPKGTKNFRIDAPAWSYWTGSVPRISVGGPNGPEAIEINWETVKSHQMVFNDRGMKTLGDRDPWFVLGVPEHLQGIELIGSLRFDRAGVPNWIQEIMVLPSAADVEALLAQPGSELGLARIQEARLFGMSTKAVGLRVGGGQLVSLPLGDVSGDHVPFDGLIEWTGSSGVELIIELPPIVGARIHFEGIRMEYEGRSVAISLDSLVAEGCSRLESGAWAVESPDAKLTATLGGELGAIGTMEISGTVR